MTFVIMSVYKHLKGHLGPPVRRQQSSFPKEGGQLGSQSLLQEGQLGQPKYKLTTWSLLVCEWNFFHSHIFKETVAGAPNISKCQDKVLSIYITIFKSLLFMSKIFYTIYLKHSLHPLSQSIPKITHFVVLIYN